MANRVSGTAGLNPRWVDVLAPTLGFFLLAAVIGIGAQRLFGDSDPATHVATGRFIVDQREIPRTDPFSATYAGRPWFAHEWLADLLWYGIYRAAGWSGLLAFSAVLIALAQVLQLRAMVARGNDPLIAFAAVTLAASVAAIHWLARPHLLTLLLLVVWVTTLEAVTQGRAPVRRLLLLPPLLALWANLHGGFLVGFVVLGAYVAAGVVDALIGGRRGPIRWLIATGACAAVATLANPYGMRLHAHLLGYFAAPRPGLARNAEFAPATLADRAGVSLLVLVAAALLALVVHWRAWRRRPAVGPPSTGAALAFVTTTFMAALSVRHVAVASAFAAWLIGDGLSAALRQASPASDALPESRHRAARSRGVPLFAIGCALAMILGWAGLPSRAGYSPERFPVELVRTLRATGTAPEGPVFARDLWGGYLILEWPAAKVFVDGRSDMYGDEFMARYARAYEASPGWRAILDEDRVTLVLLPRDAALSVVLADDPAWERIGADRAAVAYRRRN